MKENAKAIGDLVKNTFSARNAKRFLGFGMSLRGSGILVILIVVATLFGVGWNAMRGGELSGESTTLALLGDQKIVRDGIEFSVKDVLGGEGVVCLGEEPPEGFVDGYPDENHSYSRLFVGGSTSACAVLDSEGKTVDWFYGFDQVKVVSALEYSRGEKPFSLIKKQTAYDVIAEKHALFDSDYLFSVCGDADPLKSIGRTSDDHLDCLMPLETVEYASLSAVLSGQTTKQAQEGDVVGSFALSLSAQSEFYVPKSDDEEVIVVSLFGETRIYPIYPLARYPIISELKGELPYALTYDWLTDKVTVFKASINGQTTSIGFAGRVHDSNILLYDYLTRSWYQQFTGLGVWGDTAGYVLDTLPYERMSWKDAKAPMESGRALENSKYAMLYVGEEYPESLTSRAVEYKSSQGINYIVSEAVTDPKKRTEWEGDWGDEISNNLGYQLFVK